MGCRNAAFLPSLIIALLPALPAFGADRPLSVVIHAQSTYSDDGTQTIDQIARSAAENGIGAVIFSDHGLMRWEYGLRPLERTIRRTVDRGSVLAAGPERYLQEIHNVQRQEPGVILIPGVEAAPHYYWTGGLRAGLTINNWHKHLLVAGLPGADEYRRLPLTGNEDVSGSPDIRLLWPVLLIVLGIVVLNRQRTAGLLLALAGSVLAAGNYPFKTLPYDQYRNDRGEAPYQAVIDHVNRVAPDTGIVIWAHPDAPNFTVSVQSGPVSIRTPEYSTALLHTRDYTGFGYFQEGERTTGKPGGTWDRCLIDYVNGKRERPVWAVAELDYRSPGWLGTYIGSFKNILFLPDGGATDERAILRCIREGRFYAARAPHNSYEIIIDTLTFSSGGSSAGMGGAIRRQGAVKLNLSLRSSDNGRHPVTASLISNGRVVSVYEAATPVTVQYAAPDDAAPAYYRLEITCPNNAKVVTNPVFVR